MRHHFILLLSLLSGVFVAAADGQYVNTSFDDGVIGDPITTLGTPSMFHHREQVVYGPPLVESLSEVYPGAEVVRVLPTMVWKGIDIIPIRNSTQMEMDFWFGDPFEDGVRTTYSLLNDGDFDLLATNTQPGYKFKPERFFAVGDRMIAYCGVWSESTQFYDRVGIVSASISDIQQGIADPWSINFVTSSNNTQEARVGSVWSISTPLFYEGAYWSVANDYETVEKIGGQCWLIKIGLDGQPLSMVRLYMRDQGDHEHWHGGGVVFNGSSYKVVWHVGDGVRRLYHREIQTLTSFNQNATPDDGSGIGGLYQTKLASDLDWGAVTIAAGPNENTSLTNSQWKNAFILCQDPNDESKLLYGGDTSAGVIERLSFDNNGIAACETVFNPLSRYRRMAIHESRLQLYVFYVSQNGMSMAGMIKNELRAGNNKVQYSGLILSEDGGKTWGWVWKGEDTAGLALLSNGRIIVGSAEPDSTVRGVMHGSKLSGQPLFVGYRPVNLIGSSFDQELLSDGAGDVVSAGSMPEKPTPSIVHSEEVFQVRREEDHTQSVIVEIVDEGIDQALLESSTLQIAIWVRRMTPTSIVESDRMQVDNMFGIETPGASYGGIVESYIPIPQVASGDWTRVVSAYNGMNLSGVFANDPGDLRLRVKGQGVSSSAGNSEFLIESVNLNHDRPPLPYQSITQTGISSAKLDSLGLGESWSVLVAMQIPEECWDSWTGNFLNRWESRVPLLTVSDQADSNFVSMKAYMQKTAWGGSGSSVVLPQFKWELTDSDSALPSTVEEYPLHTTPIVIAISKDGAGDLNYAIAGAHGSIQAVRPMASVVNADTIRFSDIFESDMLEMYIHKVVASPIAYSAQDLAGFIPTLSLPGPPLCLADFTGDGNLNFFDVSAFLVAFNAQDPIADLSGDGSYNFFDVSAFLVAFNKGCP